MRALYRDSNGLTVLVEGAFVTVELTGRSILNSEVLDSLIGALILARQEISPREDAATGDTQ